MKPFHTAPGAIPRVANRVETLLLAAALVFTTRIAAAVNVLQLYAVPTETAATSQDVYETIIFSNMKIISRAISAQYFAFLNNIQRVQLDILLQEKFEQHIDYQISRSWQTIQALSLSKLWYTPLDKRVTRCLAAGS
ncbi:hypothetical protein [Candidatus Vallotia tarda]|uniref:Uncharacterized protein n=1 Tax=Candidatus Vallotiella hemipterorum TaxID=1177213 RepID=A0A916JS66_9BURK|nr:hypothetical protein [Candidatus Vallotia tarda]CAG7599083.1 hypothetical protein MYVALT_C_00190 [Candidatus Vallotia tarda]